MGAQKSFYPGITLNQHKNFILEKVNFLQRTYGTFSQDVSCHEDIKVDEILV